MRIAALCGSRADQDAGVLLEMIDDVGWRFGIGPDHVKFELMQVNGTALQHRELNAADLPPHPDAMPGTLPRVGVGLTAPLFLRSTCENGNGSRKTDVEASGINSALLQDTEHGRQASGMNSALRRGGERGKRRANTCPQFSDLLRASLRTIGQLFRLYGEPLDGVDFAALKAAAEGVRMVEHCYEPFKQRKWSSRSEQRFCIHGVAGGGVYENVPLALLPWLTWGGRLQVGGHRVAGAGGWRVVLD